jgi:hypothetical protein
MGRTSFQYVGSAAVDDPPIPQTTQIKRQRMTGSRGLGIELSLMFFFF